MDDFSEKLVGRFCVVEYDGLLFPGQTLDDDEDVLVTAMSRIGVNRQEDRIQYQHRQILTFLDS